jgi:hypothetical protein
VFDGLDAEHRWAGDYPIFQTEEGDRIRKMTRLNNQRRKAVEAANYLGELA